MAAVLQPHSSMATGLGSGLMSRRTAGNNLPGPLELPVNSLTVKFGGPVSSSHLPTVIQNQSQSNINALLTPPSVISGESLSPISSGTNSSSNPAQIGLPPYTPTGSYYNAPNPYNGSGQQPLSQSWNNSINGVSRGKFSPSLASLMRNPSTGSDVSAAPAYELGPLPTFPHSLHQQPISPPAHSTSMSYNMTTQAPPPLHSPITSHEPYMQKLPPTPGYSYQSMTSQQTNFPQYGAVSPPMQSPLSATTPGSRISPISQPMQGFNRPYPGLQMQGMHSPGHMPQGYGTPGFHQQPIFNSGHAAQMSHMYGAQPNGPPMDRPFKCDQCPQSFNRNHDLKRHKRIHLAVKPFPCKFCDKSFSRKDALKRHILVKGCGKTSDGKSDCKDESSSGEQSPVNTTH